MTTKHFDLQPTLTGELIQLRPLVAGDFEKLHACASDPLIWEQHPEFNRHEKEIFQKYFDSAVASNSAFIITDKKTGEFIGSSRFYDAKDDGSQINIGYTFLTRKYWGGPFNHELKTLMLHHAFEHFEKALFEIGASNWRSRKAIEKRGAVLVGTYDREGHKHCVYQITRDRS